MRKVIREVRILQSLSGESNPGIDSSPMIVYLISAADIEGHNSPGFPLTMSA